MTLPLSALPEIDRSILAGIAAGKTNKELARDLDRAEATVRNRIGDLLRAYGVPNRAALAALWAEGVLRTPTRTTAAGGRP